MPGLSLWQSHPFSVAWSEEGENLDDEKLAMNRQDILAMRKTKISFIIRERTGFTKKLFKKAEASPSGKFETKCFAEGPYGGLHKVRCGDLPVCDALANCKRCILMEQSCYLQVELASRIKFRL
jgi:hypothetical protein